MESFWKTKPVVISEEKKEFNQILSNQDMLEIVINQINSSKLKLDYKLYSFEKIISKSELLTNQKLNEIVVFINNNYISGGDDNDFKYIYTFDLLKLYCKDAVILEFYPKNNTKIVGYIIGKRTKLSYFDKSSEFLEVNFLCLITRLRNLKLAPYMINCLTKESIINYDIGSAHYTINSPIKSPYFSKKKFYHRMINIDHLINCKFVNDNSDSDSNGKNILKKVYNTFSYKLSSKNKKVVNINSTNKDLYINSIYEKYKEYTGNTYDIYVNTTLEELNDILDNNSFYNFVILNSYDNLEAFISFFRLDTSNNNGIYKNGFYYKICFPNEANKTDKTDYLELVNEYIYKNEIFDVITFADHFDIDFKQMKCIKGTGELKYYLFNYNFRKIDNYKNGLITI
jgi:hypothetical protein